MKPVVLAIVDGWGLGVAGPGNAVKLAATPHLDQLFASYPHTRLHCSGEAVGLLAGQMGDSNVGHTNIGAGRIVFQPLVKINRAIASGEMAANGVLRQLWQAARGRALHFLGLLSDGGVHSHLQHLFALLSLAKANGVEEVYIHGFLDGRDVPPTSALTYLQALEEKLQELQMGQVASLGGRYYAMDRDKRWERVEEAYRTLTGRGERWADTAREALQAAYGEGLTDEFMPPTQLLPGGHIKDGDAVFMWNFRADRARQLMHALMDDDFEGFRRTPHPRVFLAGMAQYEAGSDMPFVCPPQDLDLTLGEAVSRAGLRQLRLAETEKYAHVTFFFNGGREAPFAGEDRILVPSPAVATYDLQPAMSAPEITRQLLQNIEDYDLVVVNYANLDMVGHTGNLQAAVAAVETVDSCLGQVVAKVKQMGGCLILTADHGNAEKMLAADGEPHTAHTANPVPCLVVADSLYSLRAEGVLADLAPTVLQLLALPQPFQMSGHSLILA